MDDEIRRERRAKLPPARTTTVSGARAYLKLNVVARVVELGNEPVTRVYFGSGPIEFVDVTQTPEQPIAQAGNNDSNTQL